MPGFIPKEKLTAYERWELAAFDEDEQKARAAAAQPVAPPPPEPPPPPPPEPEPPAVPLPTAEEIEQMHADAHRQGYAAGYDEGIARARTEAARIDTAMENLDRSLHRIDQEIADQLLALAIEIAGQVLRQSLRLKPELLLPAVREALAALPLHNGHPALFLHPDDMALVREQLGDQLAHNGWRLLADPSLEAGGCRVEAGASEVDATLATRWRRVVESIGIKAEWLSGQS